MLSTDDDIHNQVYMLKVNSNFQYAWLHEQSNIYAQSVQQFSVPMVTYIIRIICSKCTAILSTDDDIHNQDYMLKLYINSQYV